MQTQTKQQILLPKDMTVEQLLNEREKINTMMEDLQAGIAMYNLELLERLAEEKVNGMVVGNKTISKVVRVGFTETTLQQAQELGATKEAIDTKMLKLLHDKGIPIPGVKVSEFVSVRELKDKND